MWLMMSAEGPYLTALIARMSEPEYNLAAYGVAFSIALIVESPVIMLMSASIALIESKLTLLKLRSFVYRLNIILFLLMLVLIFPPVSSRACCISKSYRNCDTDSLGAVYRLPPLFSRNTNKK